MPSSLPEEVTVLPFVGNDGFGAGINRAVKAAVTPLVLVTNPDTLPLDQNSLETLTERHQKRILSGGLTVDHSSRTIHSTGRWPDLTWIRKQILGSAKSLWQENRIDWLQDSLILAYRDDCLELGGFSKTYPLYFEDVDLCAKAEKAALAPFRPKAAAGYIDGFRAVLGKTPPALPASAHG